MGHPDILKLREELKREGILPADEPEAKPDHAMKQVMKNPIVRAAVLLAAVGGGAYGLDIPAALADMMRAKAEKHEAAASVEAVGKALVLTPDYVLLRDQVSRHERRFDDILTALQKTNDRLQTIIDDNNTRKGREAALQEAGRR